MALDLTPDQFRECLALLHWSQNQLARILSDAGQQIDDRAVRRFASGQNPVPEALAQWLGKLAEAHKATPLPPSIWD